MRCWDNGRTTNRDTQEEDSGVEGFFTETSFYMKRIAEDSDLNQDNGPQKTSVFSKTRQTNAYHSWEANCSLSNSDPILSGSWTGYADVPNQPPTYGF